MKKFFAAIFIFSAGFFHAQNDKPDRADLNVKLYIDSTHYYNEDIKSGAYFTTENVLQIYPTEKVFVEAETNKFGINSLKTVKENLDPTKTLVIEFIQSAKGNRHKEMQLSIYNPFDKTIKYKIKGQIANTEKWINASGTAVKGANTKNWTEPLMKIVITDWEMEF